MEKTKKITYLMVGLFAGAFVTFIMYEAIIQNVVNNQIKPKF